MMKKEALKTGILNALHGVDPKTATPQQLHQALGETVMEAIAPDWKKSMDAHEHSRRACYFSMEFLVGRAVYNNLLVLDVMQEAEEAFAELGVSLSDLEVIEDAALGNGGLGRLAACFLDSIATLGLNGDGIGLNYHFGLFRQVFKNNEQTTIPDPWLTRQSWLEKTDVTYEVPFRSGSVTARMYNINVTGYDSTTNQLHLFDVETVDESIVTDGISFDKTDIAKNLTVPLSGRQRRGWPDAANLSAVPDGICRGTADSGRVHCQGLQAHRSAGLCSDPDQRHTPHHGDSGTDSPYGCTWRGNG